MTTWIKIPAEVYVDRSSGRFVVLGNPYDASRDAEATHNCDANGCGSVGGHVLARGPLLDVDEADGRCCAEQLDDAVDLERWRVACAAELQRQVGEVP